MRVIHLLVAGLIALGAMLAGLFAAVLVVLAGTIGWFVQLFRRRPAPAKAGSEVPAAQRAIFRRAETADAIDVVATRVPDKPADK